YVSAHEDVRHLIVEHDTEWIDFFRKEHDISERTKIIQMDLEKVHFGPKSVSVTAYKGFSEAMRENKFDFICIDGPFGSGGYSRIDVLGIIPNSLEKSFVIMLDDHDRPGEQNTVKEMRSRFDDNDIAVCDSRYHGIKSTYLMTTVDNRFLCSL
ncbi:MAG: hypothetical protein LBG04_00155, partial [Holosporaceae bacterium]|nr:hypothetical protein [Holosporaceae bacterium]